MTTTQGSSSPSNPDDVEINVPGSADVAGPARSTFEDAIRDYAIDVLGEASRRETAVRGNSSGVVQYTSAYFEAAKVYVRELGHVPKRPRWYTPLRVLIPIVFFIAGLVIPAALVQDAWIGWAFIGGAFFVLAVAFSFLVERKGSE